jgi:hypothetical protein
MPNIVIDTSELGPLVNVMVIYFILYYAFLFTQSYVKVWLVNQAKTGAGSLRFETIRYSALDVATIKYGTQVYSGKGGIVALVMDRTVGNFVEQMGPFLATSWMHALLVPGGATRAAQLGAIYVLSRLVYPIFFYIGHPWLQIATVPGYLSIWYQLYSVCVGLAK